MVYVCFISAATKKIMYNIIAREGMLSKKGAWVTFIFCDFVGKDTSWSMYYSKASDYA